jgi:RimJ/RimL family protein N-acetyltransferase
MTHDATGQSSPSDMAAPPGRGLHRITLRDWTDCPPSIQGIVFDWATHSDVPAHAGRGMLVASIFQKRGPPSEDRLHRAIHNWIVFDGDRPVAFLAAATQPEWVAPEEFWPSESYTDPPPGPTMSFSTLVHPALWGRGYSTAAKMAAIDHPAAALVEIFHCEVRADNQRSLKAMTKVPGAQMIGTAAENGHPWRHFRWRQP